METSLGSGLEPVATGQAPVMIKGFGLPDLCQMMKWKIKDDRNNNQVLEEATLAGTNSIEEPFGISSRGKTKPSGAASLGRWETQNPHELSIGQ